MNLPRILLVGLAVATTIGLSACVPPAPSPSPTSTASPASTPSVAPTTSTTPTHSPSGPPVSTPIGTDVITPVTISANELQGATVELVVGQVLNITTGDLAVESYTVDVADPSVATFVAGHTDGSAAFNPGVHAIGEGTTEVTMTNSDGGIQPLRFTVTVTAN